ncbi:MAG: hypothetical protein B7733_07735 [Myxococcales bacterium FL481]|nr:MAG: hypothetical protein B7733_07735 [Myxococcales bacterium FL481]
MAAVVEPTAPPDSPSQRPPDRPRPGWWFSEGPGHEAMRARQRRDWAAAAERLDELLARPDLSRDDRGAAHLLRGTVHIKRDEFAAAADQFAAARGTPGLAPIESRVTLLEAQAHLDASQPDRAYALVAQQGSPQGSLAAAWLVVHADAARRTDRSDEAIRTYQHFLDKYPKASRRHEVRAKLATLLLERNNRASVDQAHRLLEQLLADVPLSNYADTAYATLLKDAKKTDRKRAAELRREHQRSTLRALAQRRRYSQLERESKTFLKTNRRLDERTRCEALYLQGNAVFHQRQRAEARPQLLRAAASCRQAKWADLEVKARYQAARGAYAAGQYSRAAEEFEQLAAQFADHTYADDALILAGESWQDAGKPGAAKAAYERSVSQHPRGDMAGEARRRLVLLAFRDRRPDDVIRLVDGALVDQRLPARERAKLQYLRGRALQELGRDDEGTRAFLATMETYPLSYPALLAASRLREAGEAAWAAAVEILERPAKPAPVGLKLPLTPAAQRAQLLAQLGLERAVRDELDDTGIGGWPAIAVMARAGLYPQAQRMVASLESSWRTTPPTGPNRELWQLAHPLAFEDIVTAGEPRHGVPRYLTFAVMQTESRFDPGVTSPAGAKGLVQLMPATAKSVASKAGIKLRRRQLYDPATNLDLGMRYLARLIERTGDPAAAPVLAVPSYNAGAGSVARWIRERPDWDLDLWVEAIPYDETRKYVQSVLGRWFVYRWLYATDLAVADRVPYLPLTRQNG